MIIKISEFPGLNEEGYGTYKYFDGCENVVTKKMRIVDVLRGVLRDNGFEGVLPNNLLQKELRNFCNKVAEKFSKGCAESEELDTEKFLQEKIEIYLCVASSFGLGHIVENKDIEHFVNSLLVSEESIDNEWLCSNDLKIVTFTKDEQKYSILTIGRVYLLNNDGKTIDILK